MTDEQRVIAGVPTRLHPAERSDGLLLLGHGGGHGKDSPRFVALAERYAREVGLTVVCIDAVDHGERRASGAGDSVPERWHSRSIGRMVEDWTAVASELSAFGPPVAYAGFSMGVIFGIPTVAATPTIRRAVFIAGGIPTADWTDDPPLRGELLSAATRLEHAQIAMLNLSDDVLFPAAAATELFEAIHAQRKVQSFQPGEHDDWSDVVSTSISFLRDGALS